MNKSKKQTKTKDKSNDKLVDQLNQVASGETNGEMMELQPDHSGATTEDEEDKQYKSDISDPIKALFEQAESKEFIPKDFETSVSVDSLESAVGYSSLIRQMQRAYLRNVAYYRSDAGGCLTIEEARRRSFHTCTNEEEALLIFDSLMSMSIENLNFVMLAELQSFSPRTAEWVWENAKKEGRKEFESGHLAANITFPVGYMKQLWNIARYLGVRESFIDDWQPQGGIEVALIDMMAQSYFQWQYWLQQTVKRSETRPREEHHEYQKWKQWNEKAKNAHSWQEGYWFPPYVSEVAAIEHAVQMADRFNRIFMRMLRQLRDLRRYSPVTINNPNQVNIATDGGQQINVAKSEEEKAKKITSYTKNQQVGVVCNQWKFVNFLTASGCVKYFLNISSTAFSTSS